MRIRISRVAWEAAKADLLTVRERVFVREQGVPREIDRDAEDEAAHHFLAVDDDTGAVIGCARVSSTGQIGRLAVLPDYRRRGVGSDLLDQAVAHARRVGFRPLHLHAQTRTVSFYRRRGFVETGEEYLEAGIPHVTMELHPPRGTTES